MLLMVTSPVSSLTRFTDSSTSWRRSCWHRSVGLLGWRWRRWRSIDGFLVELWPLIVRRRWRRTLILIEIVIRKHKAAAALIPVLRLKESKVVLSLLS
jgi:hypothetical protein